MSTQVDKLEFVILVDNCIEWISTLPPGFTHEVPNHMVRPPPHQPPKDPLTGLPILDLDNYCCGAHGLAIHMVSVLFDAGPEPLSIERNVKAMAVPLEKLDAIVLSHWHRDHSGGIVRALEMRQALTSQPLKVDLHPARPLRRGISQPPNPKPLIALPADPTFEEIGAANGKVELHDEFHELDGSGVGVSGEIKRRYEFERGLPGAITYMKDGDEEGWFTDELIKDERYIAVDVKGKGLVIFSSCSHAGICNVIADAMERYSRPIHMVVGGFHLVPTAQQPMKETIDFLARRLQPTPKFVLPLHCTGLEARGKLSAAMGEACIPAGVGMKVVCSATEDAQDDVDLRVLD
ncbi:hypothetical protein P7C73_g206, partial [Tremellales sp. Uapishka_1]